MELKQAPRRRRAEERKAFNRTNMELKLINISLLKLNKKSFNRTNMELKRVFCKFIFCAAMSFNRTNMELKLFLLKREAYLS